MKKPTLYFDHLVHCDSLLIDDAWYLCKSQEVLMWKENKIWKERIKIVSLGTVFKACLLSKNIKNWTCNNNGQQGAAETLFCVLLQLFSALDSCCFTESSLVSFHDLQWQQIQLIIWSKYNLLKIRGKSAS